MSIRFSKIEQNSGNKKQKKGKKEPETSVNELYQTALRHYYRKDFQNASSILNEIVERDPEHFPAAKLLAFCLIETGHNDDAKRFLQKVLSIHRNDPETLNALAYFELAGGNVNTGINYLLDALYVDETNQKLKDNLELLRNAKDPSITLSLIKPQDFLYINLPRPDFSYVFREKINNFFHSRLVKLFLFFILLAAAGITIYAYWPQIMNGLESYRYRRGFGIPQYTRVTIQDIDRLVAERATYKIKLTDEEVIRDFHLIRQYLESKDRNKALVLINKLLNSNASDKIKMEVQLLSEFVPDPDPQNPGFMPPYRDVVRAPFLYEGVFVKWSGTVANLMHRKREETSFDLLINFVDQAVVEGIAEVHFAGFLHIMSGEKVSLSGTITGLTLDNKVILKGQELQRLGKH